MPYSVCIILSLCKILPFCSSLSVNIRIIKKKQEALYFLHTQDSVHGDRQADMSVEHKGRGETNSEDGDGRNQETAVVAVFQQLAREMTAAVVEQKQASSSTAHQFLKATLHKYDIDTTLPLYKLFILTERLVTAEPIFSQFREHWSQYKNRLHTVCYQEISQRQSMIPDWYEKKFLKAVTFSNVFNNDLWSSAPRSQLDASMFFSLGTPLDHRLRGQPSAEKYLPLVVKLANEEKLKVAGKRRRDGGRGGGGGGADENSSDDTKTIGPAILAQMEQRRSRARYKVFRNVFSKYIRDAITERIKFKPVTCTFSGIPVAQYAETARQTLRKETQARLKEINSIDPNDTDTLQKWKALYVEAQRRAEEDVMSMLKPENKNDDQKHIGTSMFCYVTRFHMQSWETPLMERMDNLIKDTRKLIREIGPVADHIENEWPTTLGARDNNNSIGTATAGETQEEEEGPQRKKRRVVRSVDSDDDDDDEPEAKETKQEENKKNDDSDGDIGKLLGGDNNSSFYTIQEWLQPLEKAYLSVVGMIRHKPSENIPLRCKVYQSAAQYDLASYALQLHALKTSATTQQMPSKTADVATVMIDRVYKYETEYRTMAESELVKISAPFVNLIYKQVANHVSALYSLYNRKLRDIEALDNTARGAASVSTYESWLDATVIPQSMRNQIHSALGADLFSSDISTIAQLLIRSSEVFEKIELQKCQALINQNKML